MAAILLCMFSFTPECRDLYLPFSYIWDTQYLILAKFKYLCSAVTGKGAQLKCFVLGYIAVSRRRSPTLVTFLWLHSRTTQWARSLKPSSLPIILRVPGSISGAAVA